MNSELASEAGLSALWAKALQAQGLVNRGHEAPASPSPVSCEGEKADAMDVVHRLVPAHQPCPSSRHEVLQLHGKVQGVGVDALGRKLI